MNDFLHVRKNLKHNKIFQLLFLAASYFGLFVLLFFLVKLDFKAKETHAESVRSSLSIPTPVQYPVFQKLVQPDITADSAIVIDNDSKVILYYKNPDVENVMASTTKIMTALTALDYYKPEDTLTVKREFVEGSSANLKDGDKLSFENMLYALLLPSGNDAAMAIADNFPGGDDAFIAAMNKKAESLHMTHTMYYDPIGLADNYGTARELAFITSVALSNPLFAQIVDTKQKTITDTTGKTKYPLTNLNKLLGYQGVNGVKTGYTDEAGGVLVTSKEEQGHTIIIVVMKSTDRFLDTERILSMISGNITFVSLNP